MNLDPKKASFEPELFPALVYKDWGMCFIVYSSGKTRILGLKNIEDAEDVINNLEGVINGITTL